MRQSLAFLLILLLLIGQLLCVPHSHAGTSVAEPEGHSARPHVHLHGGEHHSHQHHDSNQAEPDTADLPLQEGPLDHDSDGVYLSETQLCNDAKPSKVERAESTAPCPAEVGSAKVSMVVSVRFEAPPPLRNLKCPLYLLTLSLLR